MVNEEIVLVNDTGEATGKAPKLASHHAETPLHLGFSCYLFNYKGQFLLTQRALSKKVWPGVWTNSVCGHPMPKEETEAAVARRADYELGISDIRSLTCLLPYYRYKTPPFKGIVENELCPVFAGITGDEPIINPEEVEDYRWVDWSDMLQDLKESPVAYSYWFKDQLKQLEKSPALAQFMGSLR